MVPYLGDFAEDATVYIPFNTFSSDDPSASVTITDLADADIKVHKDGSTTQIVTDGATIAIDFDSITGNHLATIDTSAHADYSTGSDYLVRIEGTTVDGATINAFIGQFSIENRTSFPKADFPTNFSTLGIESDGDLTKVNTLDGHTAQTGDSFTRLGAPAGASVSADIADVPTVAEFEARTLVAASYFDPATDAVATVTDVTNGVSLAAGAITDASLAGNMEIVFETDFATNYNTTRNAWATNVQDTVGTGTLGLNDISTTEVNTEVDAALADIHLDHLLAVAYDATSKPGVADALLNEMVEDDSGVTRYTVNALENGPSGSGASAAAIADAVWDEARADHTTSGSFGEHTGDEAMRGTDSAYTGTPPTAAAIVNEWETQSQADPTGFHVNVKEVDGTAQTAGDVTSLVTTVDTVVDGIQTDLSNATDGLGAIKTAVDGLNDLSAADVNAEVDSALVDAGLDHLFNTAIVGADVADNSFAAKLVSKSATADFDDFNNQTDSLQAILDTGATDWVTATGFSTHSAANVRTEMDSNSTQLAAIAADTNEIQTDLTDGGRLDLILDAILDDTGTSGVAIASGTINSIADGLLDRADGVEPSSSGTERTVREALRIILAASAGKLSGAATSSISIRDTNDSKNRIVATVDASGNRSAVTLDDS